MTLEELYATIGGNYEQALKVMRKEKLIDRYIRKLNDNTLCAQLVAAGQQMDETQLYENAHALKGVCANLGLDDIASISSEITEEFRPGNERKHSDDEVKKMLEELASKYQVVMVGIHAYENA